MKILKGPVQKEFVVKGSRFLGELFPCQTQTEAKNLVKEQKSKYSDATHVVHAFIIGLKAEVMGMSDDGEPAGTAGRPALDVLKGSGSTNILLTVTRWFGGTLLGTGGLVKAYGDSAKLVLAEALNLNFLEEYIKKEEFSFSCDYGLFQQIKRLLPQWNVQDVHEEFGSEIIVKGKVPAENLDVMKNALKELSNGKILL